MRKESVVAEAPNRAIVNPTIWKTISRSNDSWKCSGSNRTLNTMCSVEEHFSNLKVCGGRRENPLNTSCRIPKESRKKNMKLRVAPTFKDAVDLKKAWLSALQLNVSQKNGIKLSQDP